MVEVSTMFNESFLLTVPGYSSSNRLDDFQGRSLQGEFFKVLKDFLNLIYNPVLDKHDMAEEKETVQ